MTPMEMPTPSVTRNDVGEAEYTAPAASTGFDCARIEVTPTKNGGFTARCFYKRTPGASSKASADSLEPDDYAFSTFDELVAWMGQELGASAPSAPAAPASAAPATFDQ